MAKLPTIDDFGARPTPGVVGPASIQTPNVDGGFVDVGQGLSVIGEAVAKAQYNDDKLRAEDAFNKLQQKALDYTNGDEGFQRLKSDQVVGKPVYKDYLDKFDKSVDEITGSLQNDQQKQFFKRRADVSKLQFGQNLVGHIQTEKNAYAKQVLEGGRAVELQNAVANWQKPADVALSLERTKRLVSDQADHEGWSKDFKKAKELEALSTIHESIIAQAVDTDNPEYAKEWYKQNKKQIEASKYAALEKLIKHSDDKVLAQEVADDVMNRGLDEKSALAEVRKKYKGDQENSIIASVRDRFREQENLRKDGYDQAANSAWTIYAQSRDYNKIPLTTLEQMDGKEREALHAYAEREKAGKPTETNWAIYSFLMDEANNDPLKFKEENLLKYTPYLKGSHMEQFIKMQTDQGKTTTLSEQHQIAKRRLLDLGLDPSEANKKSNQGKAINDYYDRVDKDINTYKSLHGGKEPDYDSLIKILDNIQQDQAKVASFWRPQKYEESKPISAMTPSERENAYTEVQGEQIYYNDISPEIRQGIADMIMKKNRQLPPSQRIPITEREIVNRYLKGRIK